MRKLFSVLIAITFAFSITIFADVGNTTSAASTKAFAVAVMPIQTVIAVQSAAESRRCEPPLSTEFLLNNFEADSGSITKVPIFNNSIYHLPPKRNSFKRSKANIRSPDANRQV